MIIVKAKKWIWMKFELPLDDRLKGGAWEIMNID